MQDDLDGIFCPNDSGDSSQSRNDGNHSAVFRQVIRIIRIFCPLHLNDPDPLFSLTSIFLKLPMFGKGGKLVFWFLLILWLRGVDL